MDAPNFIIVIFPLTRYPPLQPWNTPPLERSNPPNQSAEHEGGDKPVSRPPNLERNEPVIKYRSGKKAGGGKKTTQEGNEKLVVCVCACVVCVCVRACVFMYVY